VTRLHAKSARRDQRPEDALSLAQHLADTESAASEVFRTDRRWGPAWVRFFKLTPADEPRFLPNLRVAALFHDIGKANDEFQRALRPSAQVQQTLRHEHLSALVLALPAVRAWIASDPRLDPDIITAAVLSHHLKAANKGDWAWGQPRGAGTLQLHLDADDVRATLARIAEQIGRPPPALPRGPWTPTAGVWAEALASGMKQARRLLGRGAREPLLLAVKAALIVADSVASGVVRTHGHSDGIKPWIDDVVHRPPLTAAEIEDNILGRRIADLERIRRAPFTYHAFQNGTAALGPRALVLAACGAGKTLAAWRWAAAQARSRPIGRVIFLYPTRGTATEGFRDYVGWAPEADAALVHGTARYELQAMERNPSEALKGKRLVDEQAARLFALGLWSRRYFSATVDQFLGFLEHSYDSLCLLPALADSAVILDEIHSYDRPLFRALLCFLESFDVPVLCMTATLPPAHREDLLKLGLEVFPAAHHRDELADLEHQEQRKRYVHRALHNADAAMDRACDAFRAGRRILWVVNTVDRCQQLALRLRAQLGEHPLVYHSRFRLCDRQGAHESVVGAFQGDAAARIAVTTQVCEMSLDLDADVLITEVAPVTSLVQRFGRANRSAHRPLEFRAELYTYPPDTNLPYDPAQIAAGLAFLASFTAEISQRDLAEALDRFAPEAPPTDPHSGFTTSGYYATPGDLRDTDDRTRSCVLTDDLATVEALHARRAPLDAYLVPIPKTAAQPGPAWLPPHLGVADSARYDARLGFLSSARLAGAST